MKTLTLKLPEALLAEIASDARARNLSKSAVVRERLTHKPGGAAKRSVPSLWTQMEDLVIENDSLPRDLSSGKARLRGYGKSRSDR